MESGEKGLSRRKFMRLSLAAGALGAAGMFVRDVEKDKKRVEALRAKDAEPQIATFLYAEKQPVEYDTRALEGMRFGPPLNHIVGIYGKAGSTEAIDFKYQLARMLQQKLEKLQGDEPAEEFDMHHPGLLEALEHIYKDYKGEGKMLIEDYTEYVHALVENVRDSLQWPRIEKRFALGAHQATLLQRFERELNGESMTAYAMTELMPTEHGPTNVRIMDFLLQNAGKSYLDSVPALGDRELSFGPYQFTAHALRQSDGKRQPDHGASLMDALLERRVLPPNVASLRGDDHYRAAYLFALYNLTLLVKDFGEKESERLLPHVQQLVSAVHSYIPAAHNAPSDARKEFIRYANAISRGREGHILKKTEYGRYLKPRVAMYVKKTHANLRALRSPSVLATVRLP